MPANTELSNKPEPTLALREEYNKKRYNYENLLSIQNERYRPYKTVTKRHWTHITLFCDTKVGWNEELLFTFVIDGIKCMGLHRKGWVYLKQ